MLSTALKEAWPALLLSALPWLLPIYLDFNYRLHPDPDYLRLLKMAALWSLTVGAGGSVLAILELFQRRYIWGGLALASVLGYSLWFPWEAIQSIVKL